MEHSEKKYHIDLSGIRDYFALFFVAVFFHYVLDLFLFLRPDPYGEPYVIFIWRFLPRALFCSAGGAGILSFPFVLAGLIMKRRVKSLYIVQLVVLSVFMLLAVFDHEVLRFSGMHPTIDWFKTYLSDIKNAIKLTFLWNDKGGPGLPLVLMMFPIVFFVLGLYLPKRCFKTWAEKLKKVPQYFKLFIVFAYIVGLVIVPTWYIYNPSLRVYQVVPPIYLVVKEVANALTPTWDYSKVEQQAADIKAQWMEVNTDPHWVYDSSDPLSFKRTYQGDCQKYGEEPWNFIFVIYESYRNMSLKFMNPEQELQATPFLEKLANDPNGMYLSRFFINGYPSVYAFLTMHNGIASHSSKAVVRQFSATNFQSFTDNLRDHNYDTSIFIVADPHWDNTSLWARRWYDLLYHNKTEPETDRNSVDRLIEHIDKLPADKPFFTSALMASNHVPFVTPEPVFNVTTDTHPKNAILNTMRYDDDVLEMLYNKIKDKPYFDRTIIIVTSDHGMDLKERTSNSLSYSPHYNTIWVPFVIYGKHPLIRPGAFPLPTSQEDIGATVLEMAGICDPQVSLGHSIFSMNDKNVVYSVRDLAFGMMNKEWAAVFPNKAKPELYRFDEVLQRENLADQHPEIIEELYQKAIKRATVIDYFYENNLFHVPDAGNRKDVQ